MKDTERLVVVPCEGAVILRALHVSWPVVGGANAVGTVEVSDPAPAGGLTIALSGSRPGLATVPPSVTVPEGESVANFTIATQQTAVNRGVVVRATYAAQLRTAITSIPTTRPAHHIHRRRRECGLHPHLRLRRPPSPRHGQHRQQPLGRRSFTYDRMGNMLTATLGPNQRTFTHQGATPRVSIATGLTGAMSYDDAGNELDSPAGEPTLGGPTAVRYSPRNLIEAQPLRTYDRCFEEHGSACTQPDPAEDWQSNVYDGRGVRILSPRIVVATSIGLDPPPTHVYFYTPELAMLNALSPSTGRTADVIWFGSRPVADHGESEIRYTYTDHLGTPIIQTSTSAAVVWRAEHEPYGSVYALRSGVAKDDQPLRFPGQQVSFSTGGGEESYNVFRWYRSSWGRYSSADPLLTSAMDFTHFPIETNPATQPYSYAAGNPIQYVDPLGLYVAPGPIIDACVKTKNPYIIAGGVAVALLIVAANSYDDVQPGSPKPYMGPCDACHDDDDDDDDCDAQLADDQARCFNWWGGSKKNYSKLKACNQSAMWRWFECKQSGVPHTPLSPTPFQY